MLQLQRPLQQLLSAQKVDQRLIHSRCLHFCFILIHRAQWNRTASNGGNGLSGICYAVGHDGRFRDLRKSWVETGVLAAQQEGNVRRKCVKCTFFVKQAMRCNPLSKTPLDNFHLVSENVTSREKWSARFQIAMIGNGIVNFKIISEAARHKNPWYGCDLWACCFDRMPNKSPNLGFIMFHQSLENMTWMAWAWKARRQLNTAEYSGVAAMECYNECEWYSRCVRVLFCRYTVKKKQGAPYHTAQFHRNLLWNQSH